MTTLTKTDLPDRVALGVPLLNRHAPGWRRKVLADNLDLSSAFTDVLGHIYGTWFEGIHRLSIDCDTAVMLGFCLDRHECDKYPELTQAWKEALDGTADST